MDNDQEVVLSQTNELIDISKKVTTRADIAELVRTILGTVLKSDAGFYDAEGKVTYLGKHWISLKNVNNPFLVSGQSVDVLAYGPPQTLDFGGEKMFFVLVAIKSNLKSDEIIKQVDYKRVLFEVAHYLSYKTKGVVGHKFVPTMPWVPKDNSSVIVPFVSLD